MDAKQIATDVPRFIASFWDFCFDCLGYKDMNDVHKELCSFIQQKNKRNRLILLPRYSFKSCVVTVGYSLWRLVHNPNERILLYSDTASKAQGFLLGIKNHITGTTGRSKFKEYFGDWSVDPHKGKWNESQIVIKPRKEAEKEPTVDTGGIESTKVGMHYDIIIFDDIVSDLNTTTKEWMDKVYECYQKSLSLLKPKGEIIVIGTRWHFGDTYGRLIANNETSNKFELFIKSANDKNKDGKLIFEDIGLDREFLDSQKADQGSYIYSCIYQNNPVDDETATFKVNDFKFYEGLEKTNDLYITGTIDPAGEGEDYTAITVVGTDRYRKMYVLDAVNRHLSPSEQIDEIFRLNKKYHFKLFGIESTFFRGRLLQDVRLRIEEERKDSSFHIFGLEEFKTRWRKGEGKHQRILSIQPYHERGDLLFPGKSFENLQGVYSTLAYQMIQYPKAPHDDLIDSLAWHIHIIRPGGIPKKAGPPKYSPAWLEKEWIKDQDRLYSRYPKALRPRIRPSFT